MKKSRISLCLINYYEDYLCAKVVSQCLPFVDEILIGDGSRGKDLLREFMKGVPKVKVINFPLSMELRRGPKFNLSALCNYVSSFASGDWLLWQDADELYPFEILENMREWITQFDVEAIGFLRCDPQDKWRRTWTKDEPKIRLWKNIPSIKWEGIAHHYPTGYKTSQIIAERYWHDGWLASATGHIYKFTDKEKQGTLTERNRELFVEPYRKTHTEKDREKRMRSRE